MSAGMNRTPDTEPDAAALEYARREAAINKGLRGVMSATLVLEAITVLLALPVAINVDGAVGPLGITAICLLAALLIVCCVIVKRPYALTVILSLQALMIAGWFITPTLGVMGLVFAAVWALILWFRAELRRRLAAGTLPEPPQPRGP
ncbi:MAG TPA: DUF4233 domain-containing protein [Nakamurella sp.]